MFNVEILGHRSCLRKLSAVWDDIVKGQIKKHKSLNNPYNAMHYKPHNRQG